MHSFDFAAAERCIADLAATNHRILAMGERPGAGRYIQWPADESMSEHEQRTDPVRRRRTAVHEAGHVVVAAILWGADCLHGVDLSRPDAAAGSWLGIAYITPPRDHTPEQSLRVSAGGPAADLLAVCAMPGRRQPRVAIEAELDQVRGELQLSISDDEWTDLVFAEQRRLREHARMLDALTNAVYDSGSLSAAETRAIVREHLWT